MMTTYMPKARRWSDFLKFLDLHKCKQAFIHNMVTYRSRNSIRRGVRLDAYVLGGFIWDGTTEGSCYWRNISHSWRVHCKYLGEIK